MIMEGLRTLLEAGVMLARLSVPVTKIFRMTLKLSAIRST